MRSPCCAPNARTSLRPSRPWQSLQAPRPGRQRTWLLIEGGSFLMGSDDRWAYPADGEGPVREISLDSFWIDRVAVSNEAFASFVDATGYATEAERFGWSFVFAGLLPDDFPPTQAVVEAPWWRKVDGADWRHPEGPQSSDRGSPGSPRPSCLLERRAGLLHLVRTAPADRGGVGVRRARRTRGQGISLG